MTRCGSRGRSSLSRNAGAGGAGTDRAFRGGGAGRSQTGRARRRSEDDPFWQLPIGDPGPDALFASPVYYRGGLAVHALRLAVGDDDFFNILRTWPQERAGRTATTAQFIALAERISGEQLDDLFDTWLLSPGRPPAPAPGPIADPAPPSKVSGLGRAKADMGNE